MSAPDVVGTPEIAAMLGVSTQRVRAIVAQHADFPPATTLSVGRVWDRLAVIAWQLDRNARLGREHWKPIHGRALQLHRAARDEHDAAAELDVTVATLRRALSRVGAV